MATPTTGADSSRKRLRSESLSDVADTEPDVSAYLGYVFSADDPAPPALDRVDAAVTTPAAFFRDYVARRRPCILTGSIVPKVLTADAVRRCAGPISVEVERRAAAADAFGQNRTPERQQEMALEDLFRLWDENPENWELYYLSTQENSDADSGEPFLGPCRALRREVLLPATLPLAGNLRLESCNLWMGRATASSGLHHDYHDNFYLLAAGTKRFRLYAPHEYPRMETHGTLHRLHENGLISYESEPTRSDGIPLRLLQDGKPKEEEDTDEQEDSEDEEENIVIGKGFDYVSSDEGDDAFSENGVDDYDDQIDEEPVEEEDCAKFSVADVSKHRPDSFSVIDPALPRHTLEQVHPKFCRAKECTVDLQSGEALYLPASWFHCVTSSPGSDKLHLAVNYWYYPPSQLDNFDVPYAADFWKYRPKANDLTDQNK